MQHARCLGGARWQVSFFVYSPHAVGAGVVGIRGVVERVALVIADIEDEGEALVGV